MISEDITVNLYQAQTVPYCISKRLTRRLILGAITVILAIWAFIQYGYPMLLAGGIMGGAALFWFLNTGNQIRKEGIWYLDGVLTMADWGKFILEPGDMVRVYFSGKKGLTQSNRVSTRYQASAYICYEMIPQ